MTEGQFGQLSAYIHRHFGIQIKAEKKLMLEGRLRPLLERHRFDGFAEYVRYVMGDRTGKAAAEMIDCVTTNHTFFMREQSHYRFIEQQVFPGWADTAPQQKLRLWSAGCSTGEEPYTLAMLLDSFGGPQRTGEAGILATDLSGKALQAAAKGIYGGPNLEHLPAGWRSRYFSKYGDQQWQINEEIKRSITFRRFNLMEPFPFKQKFHIIFCRNVMIYFDEATRSQLVRKFYEATEAGGYLFIGHSESLDRSSTPYRYVMPAVYRKG